VQTDYADSVTAWVQHASRLGLTGYGSVAGKEEASN